MLASQKELCSVRLASYLYWLIVWMFSLFFETKVTIYSVQTVNFRYKNSHIIISKPLLHYYVFLYSYFVSVYSGVSILAQILTLFVSEPKILQCLWILCSAAFSKMTEITEWQKFWTMHCIAAYRYTKVCSSKKMMLRKGNFFFLQRKSIHSLIFEALVANSFAKFFFCPSVTPPGDRDQFSQYTADWQQQRSYVKKVDAGF